MAAARLMTTGLGQSLVYAAGLVLSKGLSLVMVPVVTGYLSVADYGRLEVLVTLADLGGIVLGLGLADTLFRFAGAATTPDARCRAAAETLGLAVWVALIGGLGAQLAAPLVLRVLPGSTDESALRLLLVTLTLTATVQVPLAWLRLSERAVPFLLFTLGKVLLQAALVWMALAGGYGVTGVIAAGTVAEVLLSAGLLTDQIRKTGIRFRPAAADRFLAYGLPLVVSGIAGFALGSLDRWMLAASVGEAEMARYALAARFGLATALALQPFEMWWYARRIRVLGDPGGLDQSARMAGCGIALAVLAAVCAGLAGPAAIRLLTPVPYHEAGALVPWLALIAALRAVAVMVSVGCYIRTTGMVPMAINLAAAGVVLCLYAGLVPSFGVAGAVGSLIAAQTLRIALFGAIGHARAPIPYPVGRLVLFAGLGLALFGIASPVLASLSALAALGLAPAVVGAGGLTAILLSLIPVPLGWLSWTWLSRTRIGGRHLLREV